jgi:hypothetical protein
MIMRRLLYTSIIAALLAVGCRSLNAPNAPSGLPVIYRNGEYNFTFFLPAGWRGYSVLLQRWDALDGSQSKLTDHGPVIVLRHPKWKAIAPYQDIPIRVFTRSQWQGGEGPPGIDAGGVDFEIAHNAKYVFAIHSRFNWDESVKGREEAGTIVERNQTANGPHLHDD